MSAEAKRVKLITLAELLLGVVLVACGIAFVVMGLFGQTPFVLCVQGVLSLVFGVRGALIANVPARMGKLASLALVVLLLEVACIVVMVYVVGPDHAAENMPALILGAVPAILSLLVTVLARGIAKRAER